MPQGHFKIQVEVDFSVKDILNIINNTLPPSLSPVTEEELLAIFQRPNIKQEVAKKLATLSDTVKQEIASFILWRTELSNRFESIVH